FRERSPAPSSPPGSWSDRYHVPVGVVVLSCHWCVFNCLWITWVGVSLSWPMLWASDGVRPFEGSRAPTWVAHTSTAIRQASPAIVAAASGILALARGERGAVLRMTMIRDEVRELVALGPLPATVGVDELRSVDEHRELL